LIVEPVQSGFFFFVVGFDFGFLVNCWIYLDGFDECMNIMDKDEEGDEGRR